VTESTWESLDPFVKAEEWLRTSPEISGVVLALGRMRAEQAWELERERFRHECQMDAEHRAAEAAAARRAYHLQLIGLWGALASVLLNALVTLALARSDVSAAHYTPVAVGTMLGGLGYLGTRTGRGSEAERPRKRSSAGRRNNP
jgi:hypothetical protein